MITGNQHDQMYPFFGNRIPITQVVIKIKESTKRWKWSNLDLIVS